MKNLQAEFGERLVTLRDGSSGLRGQLRCEVKAAPGENELDFIATDESLDRYHEVIRLDGWKTANYLANPVVVDSHNYWSVLSILGGTTKLTIREGAMHNRVRFAVDNPAGRISYKMAKAGFIRSESVGFIPLKWENGIGPNDPNRTFTEQELLEISLVSVPANPGATVERALKCGAIDRCDVRELVELLQQAGEQTPRSTVVSSPRELLTLARSIAAIFKRC